MSMADGPGGGELGGGLPLPSSTRCCEDRVCNCLAGSLQSIAATHYRIAQILDERLGKICDHVEECADKILDALKKRIEGPIYSVSECQRMVAMGKQGTIEYAVRCARETVDRCDTECSLGDPTTEGKCCKTCGKSPCCCKGGVCVPCPEEEEEKKAKYVGWCNPLTKIVMVTRSDESPPGPPFVQVSLSDTEQVAFAEAEAVCEKIQLTQPIYIPTIEPIAGYHVAECDLDAFVTGRALASVAASAQGSRFLANSATIIARARAFGLEGLNIGSVTDMLAGIAGMISGGEFLVTDEVIPQVAKLISCGNEAFIENAKVVASIGLASKASGFDFSPFSTPYMYAMNSACRQRHLDPDKGIAAYLANAISPTELDAIWAIHGLCNDALNPYLLAARSKPVPLQLAVMRHRKLIDSGTYATKMRELGYLEPDVAERLFQITYQVPTLTDITRLMVRDADDETIPDWPDSDRLFAQKYGKQLREWSEAQGIPEQFAKYYWRAHWSIPSPTALFTFYHRLRHLPDFWTSKGPLADMEQALIQQDILPRWHKHYLAVSFRPMRLRDIYRGLQIGTVKESDLHRLYSDLGYSDETADRMSELAKRLRDNSISGHRVIKQWYRFELSRADAKQALQDDNIPDNVIERAFRLAEPEFIKSEYAKAYARGDISKDRFIFELDQAGVHVDSIDRMINVLALRKKNHPAIADYDAGVLDESAAISEMISDGFDNGVAERLIGNKKREIKRDFAARCQSKIRQRFVTGEIDADEAKGELSRFGISNERANDSIHWWQCELKSGERHVSASTLCDWFARGAINGVEFVSRLRRIGYSDIDASLMLEDCGIKLNAAALAKAKREAKENAIQQDKINRALERAARQQAAYLAKIAAQKEKAARTRVNRERQLYSAVDKITDKCTCELQVAITLAKSELQRIKDTYALTIDQALQALLLASEEFPSGADLAELPTLLDTIANAISTADLNGVVQPSGGNGSVGGNGSF